MQEFTIFSQKNFWKACILNTIFLAVMIALFYTYINLVFYSLQKIEQTDFIKLQIKDPTELMKHTREILSTTPTLNKIYAELSIETIIFYLAITTAFSLLKGNVFSILKNNRLMKKTELKRFAANSSILIMTSLMILIATILLTQTKFVAMFSGINAAILFVLIELTGAATITKQTKTIKSIAESLSGLKFWTIRFIASSAIFILLISFITGGLYGRATKTLFLIIPVIFIILATWLTEQSLRAIECEKHN